MAKNDIALTRVKYNGQNYMPGEAIDKLSASDRKYLRAAGALGDGVSDEDAAAARKHRAKVEQAQEDVEKAEQALGVAEADIKSASNEKDLKAAEDARASAQADLDKARERVRILTE